MGSSLFSSAEMAEGYARFRPPVHQHILERAFALLPAANRILDLGCGAGFSTRPLLRAGTEILAFDPFPEMTSWAHRLVPGAQYFTARAESIPLPDQTVDVVTAAGSLNFTDLGPALSEVKRVLRSSGSLIIYDFSQGAETAESSALADWHTAFKIRYPNPPSSPFDPQTLPYADASLKLSHYEPFAIPIELDPDFYLEYALTETNVTMAIENGTPREEIRGWCQKTLQPVFEGKPAAVIFRGYFAFARPN